MVKSSPSVKLALLAASSVGAAGAALMAFRRPIEAGLFARTAFWVLWVLVVMGAWAVTVAVVERLREGDGRRWRRDAALSLGLCLALSAVVFLAVPSQFRVLADETNLLSKSLAMYRKGEFFNWVEGYFLMDDFFPVLQAVPHRPGLFPFLTYLVHAISGYSVKAPFVVNFFVLTANEEIEIGRAHV